MTRACDAVGLSRASAYRHLATTAPSDRRGGASRSHRRMSDSEREQVLTVLNSERFADQPPREVYAQLLSEGVYLCSIRGMYRILEEKNLVHERRNQRAPKSYAVPRLEATAPNQVWTWDITKLATMTPGVFLNLYVVLDLFSRYAVAWMVAAHENAALAKQLFQEAIARYGVRPGALIVHQDRGAPMTATSFADVMRALGVGQSFSRPRVSNDNPHHEAHFRTAKYQPDFPGAFVDVSHAREHFAPFYEWYNDEHHHEGLALFRPADVFFGRVDDVAACRQRALDAAYAEHPERFVAGPPRVRRPPDRVAINPDPDRALVAEELLTATDERIDLLLAPRDHDVLPVIALPGATLPSSPATHN
jgi:transposase InsO family protein